MRDVARRHAGNREVDGDLRPGQVARLVALVEAAREEKADAVLVSQVVTQRDAHLLNTREMSAAFRESYPTDRRPLLIVGGPRFDESMADELGVDRVFTRGTTPGEVASFIVHRLTTPRPSDQEKAS